VDRGQPGVAGPGAVASLVFEVIQERGDRGGVQVGDVQARDRFAGSAAGEDDPAIP